MLRRDSSSNWDYNGDYLRYIVIWLVHDDEEEKKLEMTVDLMICEKFATQ